MTIEKYTKALSRYFNVSEVSVKKYVKDLLTATDFVAEIQTKASTVPEFANAKLTHSFDFRVFRCLLYMVTRIQKPTVVVETGVLNGFSSAFILLALQHNHKGKLYSIDIPPAEKKILEQGNRPLPRGKKPGWVIPESLRKNHSLLIGKSHELLLPLLQKKQSLDLFVHDSDHSYLNMMFEMSTVWNYLQNGGVVISDNIEQNKAFSDFCHGLEVKPAVFYSFHTRNRVWKHGVVTKPAA